MATTLTAPKRINPECPMKIAVLALLFLACVVVLLQALGRWRWRSSAKALQARLEATRRPLEGARFTMDGRDRLPGPVQRYLLTVLPEGQRPVTGVELEQTGTFNLSETGERWKPFSASQRVTTYRPGFVWDACITLFPGLPVFVRDAFVGGEGVLRVSACGLVTKVNLCERGELARGELMRFLAEAAWYPSELLPGHGVTWSPVDDHSARATLQDGDLSVVLLFHFDAANLIDTVYAEARARTVGVAAVSMPWQCRFWNYVTREGMRVPLEGEAAWITPEGAKPYWRGKITAFHCSFVSRNGVQDVAENFDAGAPIRKP